MNAKCSVNDHQWNGCICIQCGQTRNEDHDPSTICTETCPRCSKVIEHVWADCECSRCGEPHHDFSKDCTRCARCSKFRIFMHTWSRGSCSVCGKKLDLSFKNAYGLIQSKDIAMLGHVLEGDPSLAKQRNKNDRHSRTLLHYAVEEGNLEAVKLLIKHGANPTRENGLNGIQM